MTRVGRARARTITAEMNRYLRNHRPIVFKSFITCEEFVSIMAWI